MLGSGVRPRIIINARSGTALGMAPAALEARVRDVFAAAGASPDVHVVPSAQIDELLDQARRKDQPVVIGGGDGSVRAAAQKLAGTQVPLGVIPLGTMNLFAREIEMPLDFDAALEALVTGEEMRVDAASVNGDLFLCNSLMGLPAIFSRHRETLRGTGLFDGARKAWTLARRIAALRHRIGIEFDDGTRVRAMRVMALAVSNNLYDGTSGVGLRRPRLDGGELGIYTSRHRTGLSAAMALVRFAGDTVRNRFGAVRTLRVSGLVGAFGLMLAALAPAAPVAILGFTLAGLGVANMVPILFSAAGNYPGHAAGSAISAVTMVGYAGILVAPGTIGFFAEHAGFRPTYAGLALLLVVVALLAARTAMADDRREIAPAE